mgnify:CR=1 FL=1
MLFPIMGISSIENHTFFVTLIGNVIVSGDIKDISWTTAIRFTIAGQAKCPFHTVNDLVAGQVPWH